MEVVKISPRGYCHGVVKAIKIVCDAFRDESVPKPIHILGMIVHNENIINAFNDMGIITIEDKGKKRIELLDEIKEGTVIFTAHGISPKVVNEAKKRNINYIDASCIDVIKTHDIVKDYLGKGYDVLYIGKKGHPEPEGVMGIDENIRLISSIEDIEKIEKINPKTIVTNQTTMSIYDIYKITEKIKSKYPNVEFLDELCNATRIRQEIVIETKDAELCIVVGDIKSNNSKKLAEVSPLESIRISDVFDLDIEKLKNIKRVAVTSGASTPTAITKQVISYLEQFDYDNKETHNKGERLKYNKIVAFKK